MAYTTGLQPVLSPTWASPQPRGARLWGSTSVSRTAASVGAALGGYWCLHLPFYVASLVPHPGPVPLWRVLGGTHTQLNGSQTHPLSFYTASPELQNVAACFL
jgi:hypothetical protein